MDDYILGDSYWNNDMLGTIMHLTHSRILPSEILVSWVGGNLTPTVPITYSELLVFIGLSSNPILKTKISAQSLVWTLITLLHNACSLFGV